jgi:hypothetical protein
MPSANDQRQTSTPSIKLIMLFKPAVIAFLATLPGHVALTAAASPAVNASGEAPESVSFPLPPEYVIVATGTVKLRICFNWSCNRRQTLTFSSAEMAEITRLMATCPGASLHDRLQHVRIGVWQMELLAEKYQPLLANDLAINDFETTVPGRTDCIDNSTNTTTYLRILKEIGALAGWTVSTPKVRNRFDLDGVHWTAVIIDQKTGHSWSVDSWYRPNGHLPMVMPLQKWMEDHKGWDAPFASFNATPRAIEDLCEQETPRP